MAVHVGTWCRSMAPVAGDITNFRGMVSNTPTLFPSSLCLPSAARAPAPVSRRPRMVSFPVASTSRPVIHTDNLRTQLDHLRAEAEKTRNRANNARMRLMRLSEAAENLQRRAATQVRAGRESEAREMLIQRKKLMQALEKSMNRIEVLDELSAKINEAISLKEAQLIESVGMTPEFSTEDSCHQVRLIYPTETTGEDSNRTDASDSVCTELGDNQESEVQSLDANLPGEREQQTMEEPSNIYTSSDNSMFSSLKNISSYKDFLRYVDVQLREVETDLADFLRLSTLILGSEHKDKNIKAWQTSEILKDVSSIRQRISSFIDDS